MPNGLSAFKPGPIKWHPAGDAPCGQEANIRGIETTLKEMKDIQSRTVSALEEIARQGATIVSIDRRQEKADKCFENIFPRLIEVEKWIANHEGQGKILDENRKWWNDLKSKMAPQSVAIVLFIVYVIDQFDIARDLLSYWKEFVR